MNEKPSEIPIQPEAPKEKYNFPETEGLRTGLLNICRKMKTDIETNKWDILVSDETGGRIPTLVIWNLIKKFHPNNPPAPFFISSGLTYKPVEIDDIWAQIDHYKKITKDAEKALIITQFIRTAKTIKGMIFDLKATGIPTENIGVASVVSYRNDNELGGKLSMKRDNVFAGESEISVSNEVVEGYYPRFTGVTQDKTGYNPVPIKLTEQIKKSGKRGEFISEREWKKIFSIEEGDRWPEIKKKTEDAGRNTEYTKRENEPLSTEEERTIQENIRKAREDVNTLVKEILKEVWGQSE
ncbi:MAG: hypothetical protein AAB511_00085 [Patescibacteria group bacterium]